MVDNGVGGLCLFKLDPTLKAQFRIKSDTRFLSHHSSISSIFLKATQDHDLSILTNGLRDKSAILSREIIEASPQTVEIEIRLTSDLAGLRLPTSPSVLFPPGSLLQRPIERRQCTSITVPLRRCCPELPRPSSSASPPMSGRFTL